MICSGLWLIIAFTVLTTLGSCCRAAEVLQCFRCFEEGVIDQYGQLPACTKLQDSSHFKVRCPNSTMCVKEVHSMNLLNGKTRTTERRGCASQLQVMQVLKGRIWEDQFVINEPYSEDCTEMEMDGMVTSTIKKCYCRGNLCNSSTQLNDSWLIKVVCVMFLLSNLRLITVI